MKGKSESEVAQLCPTLSDLMDCSLPGSSVHGIFQARVLEWGAFSEKLYTVSKHKTGSYCGLDHELLIAKFRLKLKKGGKTTGPFRYDLNQIPYDYTVEGTNTFQELDVIDRVPEELWTEVCDIVQEAVTKTIPPGKRNATRQMVV